MEQQFINKKRGKEAVASLIIGTVSIGIVISPFLIKYPIDILTENLIVFIMLILIPIIGIILGIKGLKSPKKIFAGTGIVLNTISTAGMLFFYFIFLSLTYFWK